MMKMKKKKNLLIGAVRLPKNYGMKCKRKFKKDKSQREMIKRVKKNKKKKKKLINSDSIKFHILDIDKIFSGSVKS